MLQEVSSTTFSFSLFNICMILFPLSLSACVSAMSLEIFGDRRTPGLSYMASYNSQPYLGELTQCGDTSCDIPRNSPFEGTPEVDPVPSWILPLPAQWLSTTGSTLGVFLKTWSVCVLCNLWQWGLHLGKQMCSSVCVIFNVASPENCWGEQPATNTKSSLFRCDECPCLIIWFDSHWNSSLQKATSNKICWSSFCSGFSPMSVQ